MSVKTVVMEDLAQVSTCFDKQVVTKDRNTLTPAAKRQKKMLLH